MSAPTPSEARAERLAAQLRANLRRRKVQARSGDAKAPDLSKEGDER